MSLISVMMEAGSMMQTDKISGTHITGSSVQIFITYHFAEEDTFDLGLMEESFTASEFIDSQLYRKQTAIKVIRRWIVSTRIRTERFILPGSSYRGRIIIH